MHRGLALACLVALGSALPATATIPPDPTGQWDRDDGLGGVRIAPCGAALCGDIAWLKDPGGPAHVGERVLYDMHRTAEATWTGSALNPEDGGTYSGTMIVAGDRLTTRGCIFAGLVCKSVELKRPQR